MKRERENGLTSLSQSLSVLPSCLLIFAELQRWLKFGLLKLNQLSVVKSKSKLSLWPIAKDAVNPLNQLKLEASTCSWRGARENVRATHDWFGVTSDWLTKWREFFKPIA